MDDAERVRRALTTLPIFPLPGAVLLPHALVPLHIFEPRYRKMTRDCDEGLRVLALANIPDDRAAAERPARVLPVIGVGILARVDRLPGGRLNVVLRGVQRASIEQELPSEELYRRVRATPLFSSRSSPSAGQMAADLKQLGRHLPRAGTRPRGKQRSGADPAVELLARQLLLDRCPLHAPQHDV